MSLYSEWNTACEQEREDKEKQDFWDTYFAAETENYKKILANKDKAFEGKLSFLAEKFEMNSTVFTGFLDGINTSLKNELNMDKLKESSPIKLDIDFEKLYFNMLDAKASWLYGLDEWDNVLEKSKRKARQ